MSCMHVRVRVRVEGVSGVGMGMGVEGMRARAWAHKDPAHTKAWGPAQASSTSKGMGIPHAIRIQRAKDISKNEVVSYDYLPYKPS